MPPTILSDGSDTNEGSLNLKTLKTVFDWSWKVLPILWFGFKFYSDEAGLKEITSKQEARIVKLETDYNELDRKLIEESSDSKALRQHIDDEIEFYRQTKHYVGNASN